MHHIRKRWKNDSGIIDWNIIWTCFRFCYFGYFKMIRERGGRMSELIEFAKDQCEIFPEDSTMGLFLRDVIKTSEIKVIPLDKVKQAREEIENEVFESLDDDGSDWFTADKVSECMEILDKMIESEE